MSEALQLETINPALSSPNSNPTSLKSLFTCRHDFASPSQICSLFLYHLERHFIFSLNQLKEPPVALKLTVFCESIWKKHEFHIAAPEQPLTYLSWKNSFIEKLHGLDLTDPATHFELEFFAKD